MSLQRYVILEQASIAATVFARHGTDWIAHALTAGDVLQMPEIEVEPPLPEIYADVQVAAHPEQDNGQGTSTAG